MNFSLNIFSLDCEDKSKGGIEEFMFHFVICQQYTTNFKQQVYTLSFWMGFFLLKSNSTYQEKYEWG